MSKEISVTRQIFIMKIVCGICWIITGICMLFDSILARIVACFALSGIIIAMLFVRSCKREETDEMAEKHMYLAKSQVLDYTMMILVVLGIVVLFVDISFDFRKVFYFIFGLLELITGLVFLYYEKVGE